jgi:hypothetical protein
MSQWGRLRKQNEAFVEDCIDLRLPPLERMMKATCPSFVPRAPAVQTRKFESKLQESKSQVNESDNDITASSLAERIESTSEPLIRKGAFNAAFLSDGNKQDAMPAWCGNDSTSMAILARAASAHN